MDKRGLPKVTKWEITLDRKGISAYDFESRVSTLKYIDIPWKSIENSPEVSEDYQGD